MTARLVSLDGHPDIHLSRTVLLVGRHAGCDVRIGSSRVSRRHCCLVLEGDHLVVRDLDSTNGTWVNGDRVAVARMDSGDELIVGRARYLLLVEPGDGGDHRPPSPDDRPGPCLPDDDPSGLGTAQVDIRPDRGLARPPATGQDFP